MLPDGQGFKVSGTIEDGPATRLSRPDNPAAVGQILEGDTVVRIGGKSSSRGGSGTIRQRRLPDRQGRSSHHRPGRRVGGDCLVRPAVADIEVPAGVPLIAVPDLDDVPDPIFRRSGNSRSKK